jgi:glucosamine--fructose-6-phosphate aminotransferase (isomerizing)
MATKGQHTRTEITSQPLAWADALRTFGTIQKTVKQAWAAHNPRQVLFTGCGSTCYLSQTAAALFQELTGVSARACPASEIILFSRQVLSDPRHTLLVTISRSGTTTETLEAMSRFRRLGGRVAWGITCSPESPVAQESDLTLLAQAAQEKSVAQTRSFASMLLLAQALAATIAGQDVAPLLTLPDLGQNLLRQASPLVENLGCDTNLDRFFFLGSGIQRGLSNEAMLKMKEMSLSHSEAFHFLEFRHGPKSMVNERSLVIGLLSQQALIHERQVINEMAALSAQTFTLGPVAMENAARHINLGHHLPAWARPVLYLPPLQLLAYHRAICKGLDPDKPRHLEAVVHLDAAVFSEVQSGKENPGYR